MKNKKGNMLILRSNYQKAYPIIKSLSKANYNIIACVDKENSITKSEAISMHVHKIINITNPNINEKVYVKNILKIVKKSNIDMIIPVGFIDFQICSKYKDILEKKCIVPIENYDSFKKVTNKYTLQNIAEKFDVKYPRTLLPERSSKIRFDEFISEVGMPIVLKGVSDASKPTFLSNKENIEKLYSKLPKEIILQEFIHGRGCGYFVFSHNGDIKTEFMHKRLFEASPLGGPSVKAIPLHDEKLRKIGRRIVKKLDWTGVMMVEFKKEAETGEYYLIEINPKFWGSLELSYKNGINFPLSMVEYYMEGKNIKQNSYSELPFSWYTLSLSSYSTYGPKIVFEAMKKTLNKNILFSDLHLDDPKNAFIKVMNILKNIYSIRNNFIINKKMYINDITKKIIENINYLIFDLDGTLTDLNVDWVNLKNKYVLEGYMDVNDNFHQTYYKTKKKDNNLFNLLNKNIEMQELEKAKLVEKNLIYMNLFKKIKINGINVYVVSKQSRNVISMVLDNLGIKKYVDGYYGREDYALRQEQIYNIKEIYDSEENSNSIMFGDVLSDVIASLKNGVEPVYVVNSGLKIIQAKQLNVSYTYDIINVLRLIV